MIQTTVACIILIVEANVMTILGFTLYSCIMNLPFNQTLVREEIDRGKSSMNISHCGDDSFLKFKPLHFAALLHPSRHSSNSSDSRVGRLVFWLYVLNIRDDPAEKSVTKYVFYNLYSLVHTTTRSQMAYTYRQ